MTRLFTDGAEMGDLLALESPAANFTVSSTVARSGTYCYRTGGNSSNTANKSVTAGTAFYVRFGWYFSAVGAHRPLKWYGSGTEMGSLRQNSSSGKLELYTSTGTLQVTGTLVLAPTTWYLIEVYILYADSGTLTVKVDGIQDATFSGDTKPGAVANLDTMVFGGGVSNYTYFDDIAINNTAGGSDDSWCGDGKIIMISPNGVGDSSQLTPSSGSNWQCVDEIPPDSDTSYVESASAGYFDLYAMGSISLAAGETIRRIYVEGRVKETTAAGDNVQLGVKSSTTESWSSNIPVITSYARYVGSDLTQDPATTAAWTESGVNALQAGMKVI